MKNENWIASMGVANQLRNDEEYAKATRVLYRLLEETSVNDSLRSGQVDCALGRIARDQKQFSEAISHYQKAIEHFHKDLHKKAQAHARRHLADIQFEIKAFEAARINYENVLKIYRSVNDGNELNLANALRGYAILIETIDGWDLAKRHWQEAMELYSVAGIDAGVDECLFHLKVPEEEN